MDRPPPGKVEDLATLAQLDEKVLLEELKLRYNNGDIYTYVGDILIAVNPFRELGIYGHDESYNYNLAKKTDHPPHIYAVADTAYQCIVGHGGRTPTNQCILISGESGAGKTESTKLIIKQLVELCRGNTQLEQQILQVNPLLEAFGNAQTTMNDNSSRFGKYIQLTFNKGQVMGAKISEYLLEKSRVVSQNPGEECFHIFYYMFAGLSKEHQQHFKINAVDKYRYLSHSTVSSIKNRQGLREKYDQLQNSMDLVGFTDEEQHDMFTMVTSVLHLGNVTFEEDDHDAAYIKDMNPIELVAKLLNVDAQEIAGSLTSIETITKGEHLKRHYSKTQAEDARDAFAKILYGRLFGWIVNKINQLLAPIGIIRPDDQQEIGILDIFGFEHFETNSFEQACINLTNEQLQFFFNHHVFKQEQAEYIQEGIDWQEIKFVDNQVLLDLFLKKPIGILSVLDEESSFPRATMTTLVNKFNQHFGKSPYYKASPSSNDNKFTIFHYAGQVIYNTKGWLQKNRDTLPPGVMEMMKASKNDLVRSIFKADVTRTGSLAFQSRKSSRVSRKHGYRPSLDAVRKRKKTQGAQFKTSLEILMERMTASSPIFVRCLKPNHVKAPGKFDDVYIRNQLLYTGMLETTKIRREGFAVRPAFHEFVNKYKVILCNPKLAPTKENCIKILKATKIQGWQIGKTKVFLKYWHIDQFADVLERMGKSAIHLQRVVRGFLGRKRAARRLKKARAQAEKVHQLLTQIHDLSLKLTNQQQQVLQNDKAIPQSFFGRPDSVALPPPVPDFPEGGFYKDTSRSSGHTYVEPEPQGRHMVSFGTQMEDGEDSDGFSDDEFVPVSSNAHPGTRGASVRWFQETQATQIYDPTAADSNFIAEWFHGVISRRQSEGLLKGTLPGTFLIRVSESRFGYTLSFSTQDRVRHYMIDQLRNKKFIIIGESKVHKTLSDMIEHHRINNISNWTGVLTEPCGQESGQCDYGDLVDEKFYFTLEEHQRAAMQPKKTSVRPQQNKMFSRRNMTHMDSNRSLHVPVAPILEEAPKVPSRQSTAGAPAVPDRNYSVARQAASASVMSNRPLPKRPDEAYQRLLHNQVEQHNYGAKK